MTRALLLLALFAAAAPARAALTTSTTVAVLKVDLQGGADAAIGAQVTSKVAELLGARPATQVISAAEVAAVVKHEADKQTLGCSDDGCLAEIAAALGADVLVATTVSKVDAGWVLSLSAIDAKRAAVTGRVQETWRGESIMLLALVGPAVDKLFARDPSALTGSLDLVGAVDGSKIFVDDLVRGTAPAGQMAGVPIGARRVRVVAEGYEPFEQYVVVETGKTIAVDARQVLVPDPFYTTWWFWTATGAGVAVAAATATTVAIVAVVNGGGGGGKTGVNVSVNADAALAGAR